MNRAALEELKNGQDVSERITSIFENVSYDIEQIRYKLAAMRETFRTLANEDPCEVTDLVSFFLGIEAMTGEMHQQLTRADDERRRAKHYVDLCNLELNPEKVGEYEGFLRFAEPVPEKVAEVQS